MHLFAHRKCAQTSVDLNPHTWAQTTIILIHAPCAAVRMSKARWPAI